MRGFSAEVSGGPEAVFAPKSSMIEHGGHCHAVRLDVSRVDACNITDLFMVVQWLVHGWSLLIAGMLGS